MSTQDYSRIFGMKVNKSAFWQCDFLDSRDGYWHKLNQEEKKWLHKFACEYYFNKLDASDPEHQLHKGDKRRACYNAFNSRERCVMTRAQKGTNHNQWYNMFISVVNNEEDFNTEDSAMILLTNKSETYFDYAKKLKSESDETVQKILEEASHEEATERIIQNCIKELGIEDTAYAKNVLKNTFAQLHVVVTDYKKSRKRSKQKKK